MSDTALDLEMAIEIVLQILRELQARGEMNEPTDVATDGELLRLFQGQAVSIYFHDDRPAVKGKIMAATGRLIVLENDGTYEVVDRRDVHMMISEVP